MDCARRPQRDLRRTLVSLTMSARFPTQMTSRFQSTSATPDVVGTAKIAQRPPQQGLVIQNDGTGGRLKFLGQWKLETEKATTEHSIQLRCKSTSSRWMLCNPSHEKGRRVRRTPIRRCGGAMPGLPPIARRVPTVLGSWYYSR